MSKTKITTKFSRAFNRVGFQIKKHRQEILLVVGTIGMVFGAVMFYAVGLKILEL